MAMCLSMGHPALNCRCPRNSMSRTVPLGVCSNGSVAAESLLFLHFDMMRPNPSSQGPQLP